jgi:hypothetical protein
LLKGEWGLRSVGLKGDGSRELIGGSEIEVEGRVWEEAGLRKI